MSPLGYKRRFGPRRRYDRSTSGSGAKVVGHGSYVTFQVADVAVSRSLFQKILGLIDDLLDGMKWTPIFGQ